MDGSRLCVVLKVRGDREGVCWRKPSAPCLMSPYPAWWVVFVLLLWALLGTWAVWSAMFCSVCPHVSVAATMDYYHYQEIWWFCCEQMNQLFVSGTSEMGGKNWKSLGDQPTVQTSITALKTFSLLLENWLTFILRTRGQCWPYLTQMIICIQYILQIHDFFAYIFVCTYLAGFKETLYPNCESVTRAWQESGGGVHGIPAPKPERGREGDSSWR